MESDLSSSRISRDIERFEHWSERYDRSVLQRWAILPFILVTIARKQPEEAKRGR